MRTVLFSRSIRLPIDLEDPGEVLSRIITNLRSSGFVLPKHTKNTLVQDFTDGNRRFNEAWESYHPVNLPAARRVPRAMETIPSVLVADPRVRAIYRAVQGSSYILSDLKQRLWISDLARLPESAVTALHAAYVLKDKNVRLWLERSRKLSWRGYRSGVPTSIFKKGWRGVHHAPEGIEDR